MLFVTCIKYDYYVVYYTTNGLITTTREFTCKMILLKH